MLDQELVAYQARNLLNSCATKDETSRVALEFLTTNYENLAARIPPQLGVDAGTALMGAARSFCDAAARDDVVRLFRERAKTLQGGRARSPRRSNRSINALRDAPRSSNHWLSSSSLLTAGRDIPARMTVEMASPRTSSSVELVRQLGVTSAAALVISNMVGTGIFATTGFLAGDLGSPQLVLLIWVIGAVFALAGAFCYSELGVNFPSSGGEYVYLTRAYGPTWGFMTGWASFFAGFSAPIAAAALAFSDYAGFFNPALKQANAQFTIGSGTWQLKLGGAQLMASAVIGALTILNLYSVKRVARVQNALTGLKIAVILAFIGFGLLAGNGSWSHFSMDAVRTSARPLLAQFAVSLVWIYVAYSGWNAATYVAEELRQPSRTLPLALTLGTIVVAALFIGLNIIFIYAVPLEDMKGVLAVGSLAATRLFGEGFGGVFSALMAVSLLATINAMVTIGPRVYYAMAKNGAFFPIAARVDPTHHIPRAAVLLQGACAMVMTLTPFPQLVIYIGLVLNFFAVMSAASVFFFRRRSEWQKLPVVSFAWPLVPLLFITIGLWITVYGAMLEPRVSVATLLTITLGALIYHFRFRNARQER